ncbi:LysR family transcriptional regulator [Denitrobaculum tricleocarpae]|uniref:LysR family transcriptional regulator n=1 Tax=Denitrobaculum tricleocarpae TaxID=2591009 RepID=A0A545TF48_9PROT|nr:LysR family transcriptional regulator [Denitrobaculum tricleocarpae]TQV75815.1 LysR family transcriptional regulator [Denitrobaculum tricleocarpae]
MRQAKLADLEAFAAVARARSFRRAATERGVSASALSQTIRNLEERLGTRLLNRTTRSVALTPAGEAFFHRLEPAFDDIGDALDEVQSFDGEPTGHVRINAPAPAIESVFAPLMSAFLHRYPRISLELIADASYVDIVAEGFDAGVRFGQEVAQDMIATLISPPIEYMVVGAPEYFATHGIPKHPGELRNQDCIRQRFPGGAIFKWHFSHNGEEISFLPEGRLTVNDAHHAIRAARETVGVARAPLHYVEADLQAGRLERVLADWSPLLPGWYLYYPSRRQTPPAFKALLDFLKERSRQDRQGI